MLYKAFIRAGLSLSSYTDLWLSETLQSSTNPEQSKPLLPTDNID